MGMKSRQTTYLAGLFLVQLLSISCLPDTGNAQQPAFPGAEGSGRFTTGGRGGVVLEVTNLNDDGPGSFREAVNAKGPRTVVFRISGNIDLQSSLVIKHNDITIAGQTAPGDGICIRYFNVDVEADNVIIRYLRFRLGDLKRVEADALGGLHHSDIIVDHCSVSWSVDEAASFYDNTRFTMQWCLISESLKYSVHSKGPHGYGGIWGGMTVSFHHNLLAHHDSRNPRFQGSRGQSSRKTEIVDHRNNVIYNWGENSAYGGEGGNQNMVSNYYKYGPATEKKNRIVSPSDEVGKWYVTGNYVYGYPDITADNWNGGVQGVDISKVRVEKPFPHDPVVTHDAETAFRLVLEDAGASLVRDSVDRRIVREATDGTATYGGLTGMGTGMIDSQDDVGGWPELRTYGIKEDSDHDGMPDEWERENGLNPEDAADRNSDRDGDGYPNLENYLNRLCVRSDYLVAPAELTVRNVSEDAIDLGWKENIPNEEGFRIERSANNTSHFEVIAETKPDIHVYHDGNLAGQRVYFYRIRAFKGRILSLYSNTASTDMTLPEDKGATIKKDTG